MLQIYMEPKLVADTNLHDLIFDGFPVRPALTFPLLWSLKVFSRFLGCDDKGLFWRTDKLLRLRVMLDCEIVFAFRSKWRRIKIAQKTIRLFGR